MITPAWPLLQAVAPQKQKAGKTAAWVAIELSIYYSVLRHFGTKRVA
jgi:hypothetical protein